MSSTVTDWQILDRLRQNFISTARTQGAYWTSEDDLEHYHRFFAARIGWKWEAAIRQAQQKGWQLNCDKLLDWGCGTGIATLTILDEDEAQQIKEVTLWDHSPLAKSFAKARIEEAHPHVKVIIATEDDLFEVADGALFVASHVLNELAYDSRQSLSNLAARAKQILWVEPGTYDSSRMLVQQRELLRDRFRILAPCEHAAQCPLLDEVNGRHWCHFFAPSPVEAFTEGEWSHFARIMNIDLRSLPYSFIALEADPNASQQTASGNSRVIGRPRQFKGYTKLLSCDTHGLRDFELQKRDEKALWKSLKKGKDGSLYHWQQIEANRLKAGNPISNNPHDQ